MEILERSQDPITIELSSQMRTGITSIGAASTNTDSGDLRGPEFSMPRSIAKASIGTALTDSDDVEAQRQDHSWASEVRSTIQSNKNGAAPEGVIRKVPNFLRLPPEQFISKDSDDAEAQGEDHPWASEVRSTIQNYKNGTAPEVFITKVPNYLRVPPEQFTPKEWRFGLHNRELHTSGAEGLKIAVAGVCFADEESDAWDNFCNAVVDDPVRLVRLYGLQDGSTKFSKRQVKYLLALDALFLVLRDVDFGDRLQLDLDWYYACLGTDMMLLENQVPMDLLRKVAGFKLITQSLDTVLNCTVKWLCPLSLNTSQNPHGAHYPDLVNCSHLLDCLYKTICGPEPPKAEGPYVPIESAVNLRLAGIKIKGVPGTLNMISFQGGCLSLPIIEIADKFETVFRNLAIYEHFSLQPEFRTLSGYALLMFNLIGNLDDVKLLIKHGVIISYVGPETVVLDTWRSLSKGLWHGKVSASIIEVGEKINKHCKSRKNVIITEFSQLFCSRPWYVVSAIAVTLVTLATLIQTYTSVIGSNKMRPHFPPG